MFRIESADFHRVTLGMELRDGKDMRMFGELQSDRKIKRESSLPELRS